MSEVVSTCPRCANTHRCPIDCTPAPVKDARPELPSHGALSLAPINPHTFAPMVAPKDAPTLRERVEKWREDALHESKSSNEWDATAARGRFYA